MAIPSAPNRRAHLPVGGSARRGGFPAAQSGGWKAADPSNDDAERLPTTG